MYGTWRTNLSLRVHNVVGVPYKKNHTAKTCIYKELNSKNFEMNDEFQPKVIIKSVLVMVEWGRNALSQTKRKIELLNAL